MFIQRGAWALIGVLDLTKIGSVSPRGCWGMLPVTLDYREGFAQGPAGSALTGRTPDHDIMAVGSGACVSRVGINVNSFFQAAGHV